MPFSNAEKISASDKLIFQIQGTANSVPGEKFWYNENNSWTPIINPRKIFNDIDLIPGAGTIVEAQANVVANPTLLEFTTIRLTVDPTSNNRAFEARQTFGDRTTDFYENWVQPSLIRNNGNMSPGYSVRLYDGDPATIGTEITTTQWSGAGGAPSWAYSYNSGLLICSTDQSANFATAYSTNGLYLTGYRYIGPTGGAGGSGSSPDFKLDGGPIIQIPVNGYYELDGGSIV